MTDSTLNQYAPPVADVADLAPAAERGKLHLFAATGRIGRLRCLVYLATAVLLQGLVGLVLVAGDVVGTLAGSAISLLFLGAYIWFLAITGIKRCHDMDISGWWIVTILVPVIVLIWVFWPGDRDANRFGPPPPPNTRGLQLLGVLLLVVFLGRIIAAVTIPAYQQYVDKARAAQGSGQR